MINKLSMFKTEDPYLLKTIHICKHSTHKCFPKPASVGNWIIFQSILLSSRLARQKKTVRNTETQGCFKRSNSWHACVVWKWRPLEKLSWTETSSLLRRRGSVGRCFLKKESHKRTQVSNYESVWAAGQGFSYIFTLNNWFDRMWCKCENCW